jgi:hypothetical protein
MREYDKMTLKIADRIFENGDKILEQRQRKAAKIRHITYAVSGLCAVLIVCFGAWKLFPSLKPNNNFKDSEIVITTSTTAAETATEAATENTTSAKTTNAITTAQTTAKVTGTTAVTVKNSAIGTVAVRTTIVSYTVPIRTAALTSAGFTQTSVYTHTTTNAMTSKTTTGIEESIIITTTDGHIEEIASPVTTSLNGSPVTTSKTSACVVHVTTSRTVACDVSVTTTTKNETTTQPKEPVSFSIQEMFLSRPVNVIIDNIRYDKETTETSTTIGGAQRGIPVNRIGSFISNGSVNIYVDNNNTLIVPMEVYEIKNVPPEKAVAVRLKNTDEYYMFKNYDYEEDNDS